MSDVTTIQIDVRQALLDIGNLKADLIGIRAEMARVQQAGKDVFGTAALDAVKIANEIESVRSEYKKLESAAETLRKALALSFDPVAATKYAKALAEVETTMADIETTVAPLGVKLKDTFDDPRTDAQKLADEIEKVQAEYNQLAAASLKLKTALKGTLDPATAKAYRDALKDSDKSLKSLADKGKSLGGDLPKGFKEFNKQASVGKEVVGELFGAFTKVTLIAEGVRLLAGFAGESVKAAEAFKKTQIAFQAFLGDTANADDVIASLNRFAATNGLVEESVQQSAKSLLAFGVPLPDLENRLKQIADIAAGTGKDFGELTTIFGKARVAGVLYAEDINQLVDAGVPIISEFAKVLGTSEANVKKLASEGKVSFSALEQAFTNLTTGGGKFADLAAKTAEVTGSAARASAQWAAILREVGAALVPIKNGFLDFFSDLAGGFNKLINPTKALNTEYSTQLKSVVNLDAKLPGLLSKYETLSGKTIPLTKTEQADLNSAIKDLQSLVPGAVTEVDKYGNALVINTEKARGFQLANRELFAETAKTKLAVYVDELEKVKGSYEDLKKLAEGKAVQTALGGGGGAFGADLGRQKEITATVEGQVAARKELLKNQNKELEITTKIAELKAQIKQVDEGRAVTAPTPPTAPADATKPTGPTATAADRAKAAKDAADLIKEQAQLRADLLAEGVEKERALEEIRFTELKTSLKETFKGRTELKTLLEQAEVGHQERLTKIETEAAAKQLADEVGAIKAKEEARQEAFKADIARAEAEAATLEGIEKDKAERRIKLEKDSAALTASGASLSEQKKLLTVYYKEISEIEIKGSDERAKKRYEILQQQQSAELAQFDASQSEYLTFYKSGKKRTEQEISEAERQISESRKLFQLQQNEELLKAELEFGFNFNDAQRAQREAQLRDVTAQISGIKDAAKKAANGGAKFNIFEFLGASTDVEKDAIKQAAGEIVGALEDITAARVAEANAAVDAADRKVEAAQTALDTELQLAELGFSSDVTGKRKALEESQAIQQQAIASQKAAARQQLAIDSAQQISSIITASARIFAEGAKFFPVGLALSIAGIASLIAVMSSIRQRARAISGGGQFREGGGGKVDKHGVVRGKRHEQGGVIVPEYEDGEFFNSDGERFAVVNRKMTAEHFELLDAINRDDRPAMAAALRSLVENKTEKRTDTTTERNAVKILERTTDTARVVERLQEIERAVFSWRFESATVERNTGKTAITQSQISEIDEVSHIRNKTDGKGWQKDAAVWAKEVVGMAVRYMAETTTANTVRREVESAVSTISSTVTVLDTLRSIGHADHVLETARISTANTANTETITQREKTAETMRVMESVATEARQENTVLTAEKKERLASVVSEYRDAERMRSIENRTAAAMHLAWMAHGAQHYAAFRDLPRMRTDVTYRIDAEKVGGGRAARYEGMTERQARDMLGLLRRWEQESKKPATRVEVRQDGTRVHTRGGGTKIIR